MRRNEPIYLLIILLILILVPRLTSLIVAGIWFWGVYLGFYAGIIMGLAAILMAPVGLLFGIAHLLTGRNLAIELQRRLFQ